MSRGAIIVPCSPERFPTRIEGKAEIVPGFRNPFANFDSVGLAIREQKALEPLGESWRRGDEMPGAGCHQALGVESDGQGIADALEPRRVIARGDKGRDRRLANALERWTGLARNASAVRATNTVGHRLRERSVTDPRRTRHAQKCPERLWIGVQALPQHGVPDPLEALNLRIAWDQVVERGLDQGQRAHALRPLGRRDQGSENSIGVGDHVRTRVEQRRDVAGVDREVLAPIQGRAWQVAATMHRCKRPPCTQRRECSPGDVRARTSVY
jgi:hypothetical protein